MIRKLELLVVAVVLVVAAFSTALPFLFYLLYLAILVIGGSYVLVRLGLSDLEAGYAVSQLHGHVGDRMRVTYTLRNTSRVPKLWLEIHNPTTLPGGLPGRAITLGGRSRAVVADPGAARRVAATSGSNRSTSGPVTRSASSRRRRRSGRASPSWSIRGSSRCPRWRLPAAALEGSHASPVRTLQTTPMATSVRPYAPGDAMNRIHWKTTARHGEIQVKEFDLEQTADAWIILDLQRGDPDRPRGRVDGRGRRPRRRVDRGSGPPGEPGGRDDRQRRPDGVPAARPRRPPAPQDHAAPGRRRGRRQRAARRDAHRHASGGSGGG